MIINFNKRLFTGKYKKYIINAYNTAMDVINPACRDIEVNIHFVSKSRIHQINKMYRDTDRHTDVLSFPMLVYSDNNGTIIPPSKITRTQFVMDVNEENGHIFIGDIFLCLPVCFAQAKEYGTGREREISYLAIHGLLHLLGYDHMVDDEKRYMRDMEEKILEKCDIGTKEK